MCCQTRGTAAYIITKTIIGAQHELKQYKYQYQTKPKFNSWHQFVKQLHHNTKM